MMDLAITWLPIIGGGIFGLGCTVLYGGGGKVFGIWTAFIGAVIAAFGFTLHIHKTFVGDEQSKPAADPSVVNQQRAYVLVVGGDVQHPPGNLNIDAAPSASLVIKNTGQTPATELTWRNNFHFVDIKDIGKATVDTSLPGSASVLGRDQTATLHHHFAKWGPQFNARIVAGTAVFVAVGEINYKDVFGNERTERYRLISKGRYGPGFPPGRWMDAPKDK